MGTSTGGPVEDKPSTHRASSVRRSSRVVALPPGRSGKGLDASVLRGALDHVTDAVLVVDSRDRIAFANAAAAASLGASRESLVDSDLQSHLHAGRAPFVPFATALEHVRGGGGDLDLEVAVGQTLRASMTELGGEYGQPSFVCVTLRPLEGAAETAALDAVGRLTGELAHDLNNQLSAVLNYVFVLRRRVGRNPQLAEYLEGLQATAWRTATMVSGLRVLGRKPERSAEALQLREVVEALQPLLRRLARGAHAELSVQLEPELPWLHVPRSALEQLVLLTCLCALPRVPTRATLVLRAERCGQALRFSAVLPEADVGPSSRTPEMLLAAASLRRALRRCEARFGHDARAIWFEIG